MAHEMIDGAFRQTNLQNESAEYLARREELRLAEIDLMRHRERVAELRRALPAGAIVQNYEFSEGPARLDAGDAPVSTARLGDLFSATDRSLIIYHFMYGKKQLKPCPMCTMWIDGFNGIEHHVTQNVDFAIAAAADPAALRAYARQRGWNNMRLLSCGESTFKFDMGSEDREGRQDATISVFTKSNDGTIRHHYTAHPRMGPEVKERGIDLLTSVYNLLDLAPQGRGKWYASLNYQAKSQAALP